MNQRVSAILLVALLLSGGATFVVYRLWVSRAAQANQPQSVRVVAAAKTLQVGALIKDEDLTATSWIGAVPPGMATKKEALLGRGVIAAIYQGEVIMETRLAAPGAGGGLAATIPPGMRACAVRVNDIVGVAGFAVAGMKVDVLISGTAPGVQAAYGARVNTLLQNIEVLSAGQNFQKDTEGKPVAVQVVNLLVTPEQAELLSLAASQAQIQLVLRNPLDTKQATPPGAAVGKLYGEAKPPAPAQVGPGPIPARRRAAVVPAVVSAVQPSSQPAPIIVLPPYQIEVLNGAARSEVKFARPLEAK
jgi:pilus assembly protein CpaB